MREGVVGLDDLARRQPRISALCQVSRDMRQVRERPCYLWGIGVAAVARCDEVNEGTAIGGWLAVCGQVEYLQHGECRSIE